MLAWGHESLYTTLTWLRNKVFIFLKPYQDFSTVDKTLRICSRFNPMLIKGEIRHKDRLRVDWRMIYQINQSEVYTEKPHLNVAYRVFNIDLLVIFL